jgi:hypothetical protein
LQNELLSKYRRSPNPNDEWIISIGKFYVLGACGIHIATRFTRRQSRFMVNIMSIEAVTLPAPGKT